MGPLLRPGRDRALPRGVPFRHPLFAVIWTATVISNVGGWMYSTASGWLMTSFDPDPLIVSLVQAATTLPMFIGRDRLHFAAAVSGVWDYRAAL